MPIAKSQHLEQATRWFHALSDETRLRIIECLGEGEQCVCDLMATLDTAQSRLSFHLKTLKDAGLLNDRRDGRWMYYSLNVHTLEDMRDMIASLKNTGSTPKSARSCE